MGIPGPTVYRKREKIKQEEGRIKQRRLQRKRSKGGGGCGENKTLKGAIILKRESCDLETLNLTRHNKWVKEKRRRQIRRLLPGGEVR